MRSPLGRHSAELQLMLARMRSDDEVGGLPALKGGRTSRRRRTREEWSGGWLEISEVASEAEAERLAFETRFEAHTGVRLPGASALPRAPPPPNKATTTGCSATPEASPSRRTRRSAAMSSHLDAALSTSTSSGRTRAISRPAPRGSDTRSLAATSAADTAATASASPPAPMRMHARRPSIAATESHCRSRFARHLRSRAIKS